MLQVIIFDVGGVYLQGSFVDFVNKARSVLGISPDYYTDKLVVFDKQYNEGKITIEECFRKFFAVPISDSQMRSIIEIWTNTWKPTTDMTNLVIRLQKKYRLAILSNSDLVNSQNYYRQGWYQYFDPIVLSHEVGILKPDKKIYEYLLDKLKVSPLDCLYVDDQQECLKPAQDLGMSTLLFKSTSQFESDLKKIIYF